MDMRADQVTVCRMNSDHVVGITDGLAVAFWRYHTNAVDVPELAAAARRAQQACGKRVALIQVVPESAITPDGPARAALAKMLRELDGVVSSSAIVHEAEGFRAAMIRSIVTGLATLSQPAFPHRVFARVGEAAAWMSTIGGVARPERIAQAVSQVRSHLTPPRARHSMVDRGVALSAFP
jgi:hypothetical protein